MKETKFLSKKACCVALKGKCYLGNHFIRDVFNNAGKAITTGASNTAVGSSSMIATTTAYKQ